MANPIVFISHWTVKPGKLDSLKQLAREVAGRVRRRSPGRSYS